MQDIIIVSDIIILLDVIFPLKVLDVSHQQPRFGFYLSVSLIWKSIILFSANILLHIASEDSSEAERKIL